LLDAIYFWFDCDDSNERWVQFLQDVQVHIFDKESLAATTSSMELSTKTPSYQVASTASIGAPSLTPSCILAPPLLVYMLSETTALETSPAESSLSLASIPTLGSASTSASSSVLTPAPIMALTSVSASALMKMSSPALIKVSALTPATVTTMISSHSTANGGGGDNVDHNDNIENSKTDKNTKIIKTHKKIKKPENNINNSIGISSSSMSRMITRSMMRSMAKSMSSTVALKTPVSVTAPTSTGRMDRGGKKKSEMGDTVGRAHKMTTRSVSRGMKAVTINSLTLVCNF